MRKVCRYICTLRETQGRPDHGEDARIVKELDRFLSIGQKADGQDGIDYEILNKQRGKGMESNLSDRDLNLWDFFWAICQKWRGIFLMAMLGTALALGGSWMVSYRASKLMKVELADLPERDQKYVLAYLNYYKLCEDQMRYNQHAPLMQLDANGFYVGVIEYGVDVRYKVEYSAISEMDPSVRVANAYKASINDEVFVDNLRIGLGLTDSDMTGYLIEYVDGSNYFGSQLLPYVDVDGDSQSSSMDTGNLIRISVYASDEEQCTVLLQIVQDAIEQKKTVISQKFGDHDLILMEKYCKLVSDSRLLLYQKRNLDFLTEDQKNLTEAQKTLTDDAQAYVDEYIMKRKQADGANQDDMQGEELETVSMFVVNKKWIAIGFAGGVFLAAAFYGVLYLSNNRLLYEDDFEELYGIRLLGRIGNQERQKLFLDRLFINFRRKNISLHEKDEDLRIIYMGIKLNAKQMNASNIYLTGARPNQLECDGVEKIVKWLEEEGVRVKIGKSILDCAQAMEEMASSEAVVLFERCGEAKYDDIEREQKLCREQNIPVLGAIMAE